jgi:hypothetical protein
LSLVGLGLVRAALRHTEAGTKDPRAILPVVKGLSALGQKEGICLLELGRLTWNANELINSKIEMFVDPFVDVVSLWDAINAVRHPMMFFEGFDSFSFSLCSFWFRFFACWFSFLGVWQIEVVVVVVVVVMNAKATWHG